MSKQAKCFQVFVSTALLGALSWNLTACGVHGKSPENLRQAPATQPAEGGDDEVSGLGLTQAQCADPKIISQITVSSSGSLLINDPQVVTDARSIGTGPWSFAFLMREIFELTPKPGTDPVALSKENAAINSFLNQFVSQSPVNGFKAVARSASRTQILGSWGKVTGSDNKQYLSFEKAPFKLAAITNRLDLVKKGRTNVTAGEGRFVFTFTGTGPATVIFEYDLPIGTASASGETLSTWVMGWQNLKNFLKDTNSQRPGVQPTEALGTLTFASAQSKASYLAALQALTLKFTSRTAQKNGTSTQAAISQIRTNEFLENPWELRELNRVRSGTTVTMSLSTVKNNPDVSFRNGESGFSAWILANVTCPTSVKSPDECSYKTADGLLPATFAGTGGTKALLAASSLNDGASWFPNKTDMSHRFVALNTCSGCHLTETQTPFLHIGAGGAPSTFLQQDVVRRTLNLKNLICQVSTDTTGLTLTDTPKVRLGTSEMVH